MISVCRIALTLGVCVAMFFLTAFSATADDKPTRLAVDKVKGSLSVMVLGSWGPVDRSPHPVAGRVQAT